MTLRTITITIDSLTSLFKDYLPEGDIPADAIPVMLMFKPTDQGKVGILMESAHWKGPTRELQVKFDLRRIFSVGK